MLYLMSEFEHEFKTINYMGDMARYTAAGNVKHPDKLPRLYDMLYTPPEARKEIKKYTSRDVINLFKGAN